MRASASRNGLVDVRKTERLLFTSLSPRVPLTQRRTRHRRARAVFCGGAQARTGTGKTLAFLIPTLERLLAAPPTRRQANGGVRALVLSPTRELAGQVCNDVSHTERVASLTTRVTDSALLDRLAGQIGDAAAALLVGSRDASCGVVFGGTNIKKDQRLIVERGVDLLVATPGRLLDLIENTPGVAERLQAVDVLVLDEGDRLLDEGFRREIEKIIERLPTQRSRQSLCFSATLPVSLGMEWNGMEWNRRSASPRRCLLASPPCSARRSTMNYKWFTG